MTYKELINLITRQKKLDLDSEVKIIRTYYDNAKNDYDTEELSIEDWESESWSDDFYLLVSKR